MMYRRHASYLVFVFALFVCLTGVVSAASPDWAYQFDLVGWNSAQFGTAPGSLDGLDPSDHKVRDGQVWIPEATIIVMGSQWRPNPFPDPFSSLLDRDLRAPLLPGQAKTWTIKVQYLNKGLLPPPQYINVSWGPAYGDLSGLNINLKLDGPRYPPPYPPYPTEWDLTGGQGGQIQLPWERSPFIGFGPEYTFTLSVRAVPEPSGLMALLGGAGSMLIMVRRRK